MVHFTAKTVLLFSFAMALAEAIPNTVYRRGHESVRVREMSDSQQALYRRSPIGSTAVSKAHAEAEYAAARGHRQDTEEAHLHMGLAAGHHAELHKNIHADPRVSAEMRHKHVTAKNNHENTVAHSSAQADRLRHIDGLVPHSRERKAALADYQISQAEHHQHLANAPEHKHHHQEHRDRAEAYLQAAQHNTDHAHNPNVEEIRHAHNFAPITPAPGGVSARMPKHR